MLYHINPERDALIVVDVQYDFLPGGALPVNDGLDVIPVINELTPMFNHLYFTRDWHSAGHVSFSEYPEYQDGSWPPHCIIDTPGAQLHDDLHLPDNPIIINKGTNPGLEAYSGFQGTDLEQRLRSEGVQRVYVCGLATDYCVKNTVLDALKLGFQVVLVEDAARGVDHPSGNVAAAIQEMKINGAQVVDSTELVPPLPELLVNER
jgi:nicotinamidase/pyrazinamidase